MKFDLSTVAPDHNGHRNAGIEANRLLHILEAGDRSSVDAKHHVARPNAALFGRAARLHLSDFRGRIGLAEGHEKNGQDNNRKYEIRGGPGSDDRRTLAEPLVMERDLPLRLSKSREPRSRKPGADIGVAKHLDVPAKRDRAEFPARPGLVPPPEQLRAKADRENFDPDSIPARNQVVPEFVNKHEHGENQ